MYFKQLWTYFNYLKGENAHELKVIRKFSTELKNKLHVSYLLSKVLLVGVCIEICVFL